MGVHIFRKRPRTPSPVTGRSSQMPPTTTATEDKDDLSYDPEEARSSLPHRIESISSQPKTSRNTVSTTGTARSSSNPLRHLSSFDDSSDGFSLVDDNGDSIYGSLKQEEEEEEDLKGGDDNDDESLMYMRASLDNTSAMSAGGVEESKVPVILWPESLLRLQRTRRRWWYGWAIGIVVISTTLWFHILNSGDDDGEDWISNDQRQTLARNVMISMWVYAIVMAYLFRQFSRQVQVRLAFLEDEARRMKGMVASLFPPQFHDRLFSQRTSGVSHHNDRSQKSDDAFPEFQEMVKRMSTHLEILDPEEMAEIAEMAAEDSVNSLDSEDHDEFLDNYGNGSHSTGFNSSATSNLSMHSDSKNRNRNNNYNRGNQEPAVLPSMPSLDEDDEKSQPSASKQQTSRTQSRNTGADGASPISDRPPRRKTSLDKVSQHSAPAISRPQRQPLRTASYLPDLSLAGQGKPSSRRRLLETSNSSNAVHIPQTSAYLPTSGRGLGSSMSRTSSLQSFKGTMRNGGNASETGVSNNNDNHAFTAHNPITPMAQFGRGLLSRAASFRGTSGGWGQDTTGQASQRSDAGAPFTSPNNNLNTTSAKANDAFHDDPIAELYPDATVLFADIAGFTAWSSEREPAQVFKLLETVYRCFDRIARRRKVFKVETIGDCYLAATGLPKPQPDHAIIMVMFAKECMVKMRDVTRDLEVSLGPETGDLSMRFGVHSGPVTAGVLRGEKSRFQLFGDTVNTASRMESTGQRNRIQVSQATADLLIQAGKEQWLQARDELVNAKGKGQVQTYWIVAKMPSQDGGNNSSNLSLNESEQITDDDGEGEGEIQLKTRIKKPNSNHSPKGGKRSLHLTPRSGKGKIFVPPDTPRREMLVISKHPWYSISDPGDEDEDDFDGFEDDGRQERLIDWNVNIMTELVKRIISSRVSLNSVLEDSSSSLGKRRGGRRRVAEDNIVLESIEGQNPFDEITEVIAMANSASMEAKVNRRADVNLTRIELPKRVEDQLRDFVTTMAYMYRDNFFHNFEHASHVTMSAHKLLQRVVSASKNGELQGREKTATIISDPLICFAIVFSAFIHDVDHTGVSNAQLIKEEAHIASLYEKRSVAEQNSLDLAWELLMSSKYADLRRAIFANKDELARFRQLVVNVILATDIFDKDMVEMRNSRWEKAFGETSRLGGLDDDELENLKATIVVECIIQASDVSHTMQHWQVYTKWNARLFEEMFSAFQTGRADKDPSEIWYQGELWFFDNYIIPLANKLKECNVFGTASDQFLTYALENRKEWEAKGKEIVEALISKHSSS